MDPIIRAAAVTAARRPLGRPGAAPVQHAGPAALAVPAAAPAAPLPDPEQARAALEQAEAQRRAWQAEEAAARAQLQEAQDDLQRREQQLQAERQAHAAALQDAHEEAARRGHEEGLARGVAEGRAGADAAAAARLAQLDALALGMEQAAADALARHEDLLVEVAWSAICRLAGELAAGRDGALAMVRTAMSAVRDSQQLRVRMHPQDAAWLAQHGEPERWSLQGDPAVALGGCIVDGAHGSLDARLELQLERLRAALAAARAARTAAVAGAVGPGA